MESEWLCDREACEPCRAGACAAVVVSASDCARLRAGWILLACCWAAWLLACLVMLVVGSSVLPRTGAGLPVSSSLSRR